MPRTLIFAASLCSPRSPCLGDLSFQELRTYAASLCSPRSPCLGALSFHGFAHRTSERSPCLGALSFRTYAASLCSPFQFRPRNRTYAASLCSPRSPCLGALSFHGFAHRIRLTQQASVRQVPYLFTVSLTESEASAFLPNRVCVSPIEDRDLRTPAAACVW